MRDIAFCSVLVIIFLFSANYAIYSEELSENDGQNDVNEEPTAVIEEKKRWSYGFSIGPQFGFVYAQAVEIVYPIQTKGEYLSELLWNMKPLFYMGLQVDFGLNDIMSKAGYFSNLSFKAGFPGETGIHENRDWMSVENSNLTHYSKHTIKTNEFFVIDWRNGASIPLTYLYIKPFINFSWMRFSFSGLDGYGTYARKTTCTKNCVLPYLHQSDCPARGTSDYTTYHHIDDNPHPPHPFKGEVITYEQNWLLLAPGITIGTKILSPFSFDISFQISPLTYCAAVDHHKTRNLIFYDYTNFGLFIEGTGNVTFNWNVLELTLEYSYRHIGDTIGDTYYGSQSSDRVSLDSNKAGAGLSMMDTRFLVKFRF